MFLLRTDRKPPAPAAAAVVVVFSSVIGGLMVVEGYGSPPSLVRGQDDGSGWLTVRKYNLGVTGDAFIEPVKLTEAVS